MSTCFFVSDLHGREERYKKLFQCIEKEHPAAVFMGGDLLPSGLGSMTGVRGYEDFLEDMFAAGFRRLKKIMNFDYPSVFVILGNDDVRIREAELEAFGAQGLWNYVHNKCILWGKHTIYGYAYIPPTPFMLKDWERYDVSRYLDPLCIAPEEGWFSVSVEKSILKHQTIQNDLLELTRGANLSRAIFLFHTPPYDTNLDRAALDGKKVNYVDLDVHVGSIAVRRFIESGQPLLTLHGHIHESARITRAWRDRIGRTFVFSSAHDGPELALVRFDPEYLETATRELI
ncbi:MAG: metallophosphoesterase [Acidobacteria bacterium]|nr:metallophosphoesterase [Acidobacteriota bacterium]